MDENGQATENNINEKQAALTRAYLANLYSGIRNPGVMDGGVAGPIFPFTNFDCSRAVRRPVDELFKGNPFEPSRFRQEGLAVWDLALRVGRKPGNAVKSSYRALRRVMPTVNSFWADTMSRVALFDRSYSKEKHCVDYSLQPHLLTLAHEIAHSRIDCIPKADKRYAFCSSSHIFAQAVAEVTVAWVFGLPLRIGAKNSLPKGLVAVPTLQFGFTDPRTIPAMVVRMKEPHVVQDVDSVFILVSIQPGYDPLAVYELGMPTASSEYDKMAYLPYIATIAGWETLAGLTCGVECTCERFGPYDPGCDCCLGLSVYDLQPPKTLPTVFSMLTDRMIGYTRCEDLLSGPPVFPTTPGLPCLHCLLKNPNVENGAVFPFSPFNKKSEEVVAVWRDFIKVVKTALKHSVKQNVKTFGKEWRKEYHAANRAWRHYCRRARKEQKEYDKRFR